MATLVTKINAHANSKLLGLNAAVSGNNISLTYSDSTGVKTLAISGGDKYYGIEPSGAGRTLGNGLNNKQNSINLFSSGFGTSTTTVASANSSTAATGTVPLKAGDAISVTINNVNGGSAISLGTVGDAATLAGLVTSINASDGAKQYGIDATIVQDSNGLYNIKLSAAGSALATSFVFNPGTNVNNTGVNALNATPAISYGHSVTATSLFTSTFANSLTAGQTVLINGTTTASTPFRQGDTLQVVIPAGGALQSGAAINISSALAAGDTTLTAIVANINAFAATNYTGVTARLNAAGEGGTAAGTNIILESSTPILAFRAGANFFEAGAGSTSALNNNKASVNLLSNTSGYASGGATAVVTVAGAAIAGRAFDIGTLTVSINGGASISLGSTTSAQTLDQLIGTINTALVAADAGIYAARDDTDTSNRGIRFFSTSPTAAPITSVVFGGTAISGAGAEPARFRNGINGTTVTTSGADLTLTAKTAGTEKAQATATDTTVRQQVFGLNGGSDSGLGYNSVSVSGTVGDNLLTALSQTRARILVSFPDIDASALTATGNFNSDGSVYITVGGKNFAFTTTAANAKASDEITIGATLRETLDNAVATINNYAQNVATGSVAYDLNQINIARSGNSLVFTGKALTNPAKITGAALDAISVSSGFTNGAVSSNSGLLNNAAINFGVDANGISNKDFTGTISGFQATATGVANTVNLSLKVGAYTYTASNVPTASTSNTVVRLTSDVLSDGSSGGFFDIQLDSSQGQAVNSDTDAKAIAQRLNSAFSSLNFAQKREIASYSGTQTIVSGGERIGSLIGSKVSGQLASFSGNKLTGITVTAPATANGDAVLSLNIDGETFVTGAGLGNKLGANQTYRLTSTTNANNFIDFTTGSSSIDISSSANASAVQKALGDAFGTAKGDGALTFQIGATSADSIAVSIGSAKTSQIYDGQTLSVATQSAASNASVVLDSAIRSVTALRASVGALGSRFNFASAALQSSVQNQDAARAQLLDTDIALESTAYATSQVKLQAGISVLAQANQALQALLKLIG